MEYSIGNGLAFLADRTGTEFAVLVSGGRAVPSAGRVIATVGVMAMGYLPMGNDKAMMATVIELRTGNVVSIFLADRKLESEPYYVPGANTWMHALFESFPDDPRNEPSRKSAPANNPIKRYESSFGFSFLPPRDWHVAPGIATASLTRHSTGLEMIRFDRHSLKDFSSPEPMEIAGALAERARKSEQLPGFEVSGIEPMTVAERPGFRIEMRSTRDFLGTPIRFHHQLYGVASDDHVYLMEYAAPAIHYFDAYLPQAEALLATFKVR
jgi:hypothetical protein